MLASSSVRTSFPLTANSVKASGLTASTSKLDRSLSSLPYTQNPREGIGPGSGVGWEEVAVPTTTTGGSEEQHIRGEEDSTRKKAGWTDESHPEFAGDLQEASLSM